MKARPTDISLADFVLPLLALWSFALAQPLYDLLLRNPTYLTAHDLVGAPLFGFVVVVSFVLPLGIFTLLFSLVPKTLQRTFYLFCAGGLVIAFVNGLLRKLFPSIEPALEFAVALVIALILVLRLGERPAVLSSLRLAAVAALIFPAYFLLQLPSSFLGFLEGAATDQSSYELSPEVFADTPDVVLVIFDELALTTLIDSQGVLDRSRFPHFAALASEATWYRQASTVAAGTRMAVPAILTGDMPDADKAPDVSAHPKNLFTLLKGVYSLNVEEPITRLCGYAQCHRGNGLRLVFLDTLVVLAHLGAPKWLVNRLPPIGGHWAGFYSPGLDAGSEGSHGDERVAAINRFVQGFADASSPGLHVLHSVLPHLPYTLLPAGQRLFRHEEASGHVIDQRGDRFIDEPWAVTESRYLYEWQLQYVDRSLGRLVEGLKAAGKYHDSLLIVMADHGVRFAVGESRREPRSDSFLDIASIPLFIKEPGQTSGAIEDGVIQSTDVLPIIKAVLGVMPVDETTVDDSMNNGVAGSRPSGRSILSPGGWVDLPNQLDFTTRANLESATLWAENHVNHPFLGSDGDSSPARCEEDVTLSLSHEALYQTTYPEHFLAAQLLFQSSRSLDTALLQVKVNDTFWPLHQTGELHYSGFIDPDVLKAGYNSVAVYQAGSTGLCTLYELP